MMTHPASHVPKNDDLKCCFVSGSGKGLSTEKSQDLTQRPAISASSIPINEL
jgi:hypothetical protein